MAWTRCTLSNRSTDFLAFLPLVAETGDLLFVHADASVPSEWNYITGPMSAGRSLAGTNARVTFCGHVHVPQLFRTTAEGQSAKRKTLRSAGVTLAEQHRWLVVVGSVGQPRDGNPAAAFVTYDTVTRTVNSRRVRYDAGAVAARIRAHGLPESLARRLVVGR